MKRILLYTVIITAFMACSRHSQVKVVTMDGGFVEGVGRYRLPSSTLLVRELSNGTITFAAEDKDGNLLLQHNLFRAFSKYHRWCIFVDDAENFWLFSADYPMLDVWQKVEGGSYEKKDCLSGEIVIPKELKEYIGLERYQHMIEQWNDNRGTPSSLTE